MARHGWRAIICPRPIYLEDKQDGQDADSFAAIKE